MQERRPIDVVDVFRDFLKPMVMASENYGFKNNTSIIVDVRDNKDNITIHAELPGVNKEDIHASIEDGVLSISAEIKKLNEVKDGDIVIRSERYYGKVSRSFTVGVDIDEESVTAKYENGILEMVLPKRQAPASNKKINIV